MILSDLKHYLAQHGQVTLRDIATHFDVEPDAMRGMLSPWMHKGKVRKVPPRPMCAGCCQCDPAFIEVYEWLG
jgi:predicted ArsR family transcriptional regulator